MTLSTSSIPGYWIDCISASVRKITRLRSMVSEHWPVFVLFSNPFSNFIVSSNFLSLDMETVVLEKNQHHCVSIQLLWGPNWEIYYLIIDFYVRYANMYKLHKIMAQIMENVCQLESFEGSYTQSMVRKVAVFDVMQLGICWCYMIE